MGWICEVPFKTTETLRLRLSKVSITIKPVENRELGYQQQPNLPIPVLPIKKKDTSYLSLYYITS